VLQTTTDDRRQRASLVWPHTLCACARYIWQVIVNFRVRAQRERWINGETRWLYCVECPPVVKIDFLWWFAFCAKIANWLAINSIWLAKYYICDAILYSQAQCYNYTVRLRHGTLINMTLPFPCTRRIMIRTGIRANMKNWFASTRKYVAFCDANHLIFITDAHNAVFGSKSWTISDTWFLGPTRVLNANVILITSAVFCTAHWVTDRQTDQQTTRLGR